MHITASAQTDVGNQRGHNEDACLVDNDLGLYIVCDGMGGHASGEVASQETIRVVQQFIHRQRALIHEYIRRPSFEQRTRVMRLLEDAVDEACAQVYALGQREPARKGMGTTIAMLLTLGEAVMIAHAGDSRIYLIRDQQAHQLTEDHSLVWHMLKSGKISKEEAAHSPYANVITRSVGTRPTVQVDTLFVECLAEDRFVLCSDGLHTYLQHPEELAQLSSRLPPQELVAACIALANERGGRDNITVLAVQIEHVQRSAGEAGVPVTRKIEALKHIRFFRACDTHELVKILNIIRVRSYEPGDILIAEDTVGDEFFLLLSGQVDVLKKGQKLLTLSPGMPFGETALLERATRSATVQAIAPTTVMILHGQDFYAMLEQEPSMAVKLLRSFVLALHQRLRITSSELVEARGALASLHHDAPLEGTVPTTIIDLPPQR
ncbi:MAG: Stp1/IreP family PP2C-type Ser/Thr phosphatase [Candidatus Tectimicrobiota bacterium]